jgi:bacterioferritin (cytochrome b1)
MLDSATMPPPAPVAVIDALNGLLEAELGSVFRFMAEGSPYLSRATVEVKRPLEAMVETNNRHAAELSDLIESLGGYPLPRSLRPEEQYLAFLSLKFLLPKLANEKRFTIERYENALAAMGDGAPPVVRDVLRAHVATHRRDLETLNKAAADAARVKA